jgi:hypothetical protein
MKQTLRTDNNKEYLCLQNLKFGGQKIFAFTRYKKFFWCQNLTNVCPINLKLYNQTDANEKTHGKKRNIVYIDCKY